MLSLLLSRPSIAAAMASRHALARQVPSTIAFHLYCCEASTPAHFRVLNQWLELSMQNEERRRMALCKEAEHAASAEALGKWATLIVSNLYRIDSKAERVVVEDWQEGGKPIELKLDSSAGTPQEQAEEAFRKARRLRRGSAVVAGVSRKRPSFLLDESAAIFTWPHRPQDCFVRARQPDNN